MKFSRTFNFTIRLVAAIVLGVYMMRMAAGSGTFGAFIAAFYGFVLFLLFGLPLAKRAGQAASRIYEPDDSQFRIVPEYSVAEARVKEGKYAEAVDEYRKVIAEHPEDVYPHLRIADLALAYLNDVKLAELELFSALGKAAGPDTTAIAAGRLADFYQFTLQQPQRALDVMEQLRAKLPGTKHALLAEERIRTLQELVAGRAPPKKPTKIAHRTADEETLRRRRGF